MVVLQIIIVPLFSLILVGTVFMIGVSATISPPFDGQDDQPLGEDSQYYPSGRLSPPT